MRFLLHCCAISGAKGLGTGSKDMGSNLLGERRLASRLGLPTSRICWFTSRAATTCACKRGKRLRVGDSAPTIGVGVRNMAEEALEATSAPARGAGELCSCIVRTTATNFGGRGAMRSDWRLLEDRLLQRMTVAAGSSGGRPA